VVVFELGDVLCCNLVGSKPYSVFLTLYSAYFTERLGDAFAIIADMRAKKINIQCRTCSKAFVCIHQCSTFQVEVLTVMSL